MSQKETPADVSAQVKAMAPDWALVADVMGGTDAMRKAGKQHLPKAPAESDDAYADRLATSTLFGAYRRTVETMAARPFAEPVKFGEDVPPKLTEYAENIDLEGRDLQSFTHSAFQTALAYGLTHVLVEYPTLPAEAKTLADERAIGARPYFVEIHPRNVLGWRAQRIAGVQTLTQFRFKECVQVPDGEWGTAEINQVRVLEPTVWRKYRQNDKGDWALFEEGPVSIGCIPLATIYTGRTGFMTAEPPLLALAHLNIKHWQKESDSDALVHVASVPILFASGFQPETFTLGAGSAVTNDDSTAKLMYVEHTGAAIGAGRQSLLDLEERMAALGAELLRAVPGPQQTATKVKSDVSETTSALAAMVNNLEDSLAMALQFAAKWDGLPEGGTIELEGDFTAADPLDAQSLIGAKEKGILSAQTAFLEFQRAGLIDEDLTWEDEVARLALDAAVATQAAIDTAQATAGGTAANDPSGGESGGGGTPAPGGGSSPPAPDFGPLLASIDALVGALNKPAPEAPEPPEQIDLSGLVDAIRAMPAPVVNMPEHKDDGAAQAAMLQAVLTMADAMKNGPAPVINIAPPSVTVEAAQVTVEAPAAPTITMPPINVTIEKGSGKVTFTENADGEITGAKLQ